MPLNETHRVHKTPRTLKSLAGDDLITFKDKNDDYLVVTKIETRNVIKEFIENELEYFANETTKRHRRKIEQDIENRMSEIEKSISAYIDYKFDKLTEKTCELILTRKFNEEVERKVKERLDKRGKF